MSLHPHSAAKSDEKWVIQVHSAVQKGETKPSLSRSAVQNELFMSLHAHSAAQNDEKWSIKGHSAVQKGETQLS